MKGHYTLRILILSSPFEYISPLFFQWFHSVTCCSPDQIVVAKNIAGRCSTSTHSDISMPLIIPGKFNTAVVLGEQKPATEVGES